MKFDISKLPFDELKHYLGVFLQMGRVQLDSDWNEQSEIWLRLLQRHANDTVDTGSPNHGFRVGDRILLDAMDDLEGWSAAPAGATLFVDYFDHRIGEGSLTVEGATAVVRTFEKPLDLSGLRDVVFAVKHPFSGGEEFFLGEGGTRFAPPAAIDPVPVEGWTIVRVTVGTPPPGFDLAKVDEYGFRNLQAADRYLLDSLEADLPLRSVLVPTRHAPGFALTPKNVGDVPTAEINDDNRIWRSTVLEVEKTSRVKYELPIPRDLRRVRKLVFAVRSPTANAKVRLRLIDSDGNFATTPQQSLGAANAWETLVVDPPSTGINLDKITSVQWRSLTAQKYLFSPILIEQDLDEDLVIMGGDGTSEGAGRFYGDGLAAIKESHGTYTSQAYLPQPDLSALEEPGNNTCRIDLAYLDLWERPITYIEDPAIREIALEGPDTCTRTQLVGQVRILKGAEAALPGDPVAPTVDFDKLPRCGLGTLTTKDKPDAVLDPCADPCEPEVSGTFVGEANRLYRVEIHTYGDIGAEGAAGTALFKWSRENGAVATALTEDADAAALSAVVEKPELYRVGDLIEISDDRVDLVTGPFEDIVNHLDHKRGEIRKITGINLQDRRISWEDALAADPTLHAGLDETYYLGYHAKIRRWEGLESVTAGDIVLDDGVVIEFGGQDLSPGDYWVFTTRVVDRSVERLIEEPPRGLCHRYFKLASLTRCNVGGTPALVIDDCRPTFNPLTDLQATDVAFDPTRCAVGDVEWEDVKNVQEAIELLCQRGGGGGLCSATVGDGVISHGEFGSIEAAVASLGGNGGVVCVLRGNHFVTETINVPSNVTIRGSGPATRIAFVPAATTTSALFSAAGSKRVRFEDFFAVTALGGRLINLERSERVRIERCSLANAALGSLDFAALGGGGALNVGSAIAASETKDVIVADCRLVGGVGIAGREKCTHLKVRDTVIRAPIGGLSFDNVQNLTVSGCELGGIRDEDAADVDAIAAATVQAGDLADVQTKVQALLGAKPGLSLMGFFALFSMQVLIEETQVSALIGVLPLFSLKFAIEESFLFGGVGFLPVFGVMLGVRNSVFLGFANVVGAGLAIGLDLHANQFLGVVGLATMPIQYLLILLFPVFAKMAVGNNAIHGKAAMNLPLAGGMALFGASLKKFPNMLGIGAAAALTIRDNLFLSVWRGIWNVPGSFATDVTIAANRFYLCTGEGVLLEGARSLFTFLGQLLSPGVNISENHFSVVGRAVETELEKTGIVDNRMRSAGDAAIVIGAGSCEASGNLVQMTGTGDDADTGDAAVVLEDAAIGAVISGNRLLGGRGSGILIDGEPVGVVIESNGIIEAGLNGITVSSRSKVTHRLTVRGNQISGCLAESQPALFARAGIAIADGQQVSITDNRVWQNGKSQTAAVHGIYAEDLSQSVISDNHLWGNGNAASTAPTAVDGGGGLTILNARQDVQILDNTVRQNRGYGIRVHESSGSFFYDVEILSVLLNAVGAMPLGGNFDRAFVADELMVNAGFSENEARFMANNYAWIIDDLVLVGGEVHQTVSVSGNTIEGSRRQTLLELRDVDRLVVGDNRIKASGAAQNAQVPVEINAEHLIFNGNHVETTGDAAATDITSFGDHRFVIVNNILSGSSSQLPSFGVKTTLGHNLFF